MYFYSISNPSSSLYCYSQLGSKVEGDGRVGAGPPPPLLLFPLRFPLRQCVSLPFLTPPPLFM